MIGAGAAIGGSSPAASTPVPGAGNASAPAASSDAGPAPAAAAAPGAADRESASTSAQAGATVQHDAVQRGRNAGDAATADFAALLVANEPVAPAAPAVPAPLRPETDDASQAAASAAASPEQLLALLAGSLAIPATPQPVQAPASPEPAIATAVPFPSAAAKPVPTPMAGAADGVLPSLPAASAGPNAGRTDVAITSLAPVPADATAGAAAPDSGTASFDAFFAQPAAAPASTGTQSAMPIAVAAPLSVPADPDAGFDDGLGARIAWMAEQRVGHAEIRLNPENVGPIDVRVHIDGNRVNAEFHSAHAEVRQALEASVPRLREMLGHQGLQLGHADIGQRHGGQDGARHGGQGDGAVSDGGRDDAPEPASTPRLRSRGLLDEYA